VTSSGFESVTLKVATPDPLVVAFTAVMCELVAPCPKVTLCPETGVPEASSKVTVTVEVDVPLSVTEVGLAVTEEVAGETRPWKVTAAVSVRVTELVVSVAV
jgi:hypothetical protein